MTIKGTICLHCKKTIRRPKPNQKYHKSCFKEHRKLYKREKEKQYYKEKTRANRQKYCKICHDFFTAEHGNLQYCSECKSNIKSIFKGFKSELEEISFKNKICYKCNVDLIFDYIRDTYKCLNCGYERRALVSISRKSILYHELSRIVPNDPYDREFREIRGKGQEQNISNMYSKLKGHPKNVVFSESPFCSSCGMLKNRCTCESTVQKIQ